MQKTINFLAKFAYIGRNVSILHNLAFLPRSRHSMQIWAEKMEKTVKFAYIGTFMVKNDAKNGPKKHI